MRTLRQVVDTVMCEICPRNYKGVMTGFGLILHVVLMIISSFGSVGSNNTSISPTTSTASMVSSISTSYSIQPTPVTSITSLTSLTTTTQIVLATSTEIPKIVLSSTLLSTPASTFSTKLAMPMTSMISSKILTPQTSTSEGSPKTTAPEVPREFTVEILVVVDHSIYKQYQDVSFEDGEVKKIIEVEQNITDHYQMMIQEVNGRLNTLDNLMFAVNAVISGIYIIKDESEALWQSQVTSGGKLEVSTALDMFNKMVKTVNVIHEYDHAMLFTRYDLTYDESDTVAGYANLGKMCSTDSVSVVEEFMTSQIHQIAVHELGHSLGAKHDGEDNDCSEDDNNIMSESFSITNDLDKNRNSWRFSRCSTEYITGFLQYLDSIDNNCLEKKTNYTYEGKQPSADNETVVYEVPSPDVQCAQKSEEDSHLCRSLYGTNYTDFCALMYCSVDDSSCSFQLPLDGTPCGHKKVCKSGYCVYQISTTATDTVLADSCPFGDQPGPLDGTLKSCEETISRQPFFCYQATYRYKCCLSCSLNYTGVQGCEYGNKLDRCGSTSRYDCLINSEDCCDTCAYYMQTMSELIPPIAIAGGIVIVIIVIACLLRRRRRRRKEKPKQKGMSSLTDRRDWAPGFSSNYMNPMPSPSPQQMPYPYNYHDNIGFPMSPMRCPPPDRSSMEWGMNQPWSHGMGLHNSGSFLNSRTMAAMAFLQGMPPMRRQSAISNYSNHANPGPRVSFLRENEEENSFSVQGLSNPTLIDELD